MKKLMIAAAAAAMFGGVYANECGEEDTVAPVPTLVYSITMNVKTTKGVDIDGYAVGGLCGDDDEDVPGNVIREKDTTKFQGWIYDCTATCDTIANGSLVLWDSKRKAQFDSPEITTTFINVMGKKQKDAEWAWTFGGTVKYADHATCCPEQTYTLTGAGYGKFDAKKGYYTSFSGNFAGTATASYQLGKKRSCIASQIWKCDALTALADSDTVAFGTWSAKLNSNVSKKFATKAEKALKVPSYVKVETSVL